MKQILALLFLAGIIQAQPANPDCGPITFTFVGGNGTAGDANGAAYFDNRARACDSWTVSYQADSGLSGFTLAFLYSTGTTMPGSFIAWPANQSNAQASFGTATNGLATFCNLATCVPSAGVTFNTPWVQVSVTGASGTGNINSVFYGYRTGSSGGGTGGGGGGTGCPNPCPVHGDVAPGSPASNPVTEGARNDAGNVVAYNTFPDQADISASAVTAVKVVAGSSGKLTYVGHLSIAMSAATTVSIEQGTTTSTPCDTSATTLFGPYQNTVALALDWPVAGPLHTTTTGDDLCLIFGGSTTGGGGIVYGQH